MLLKSIGSISFKANEKKRRKKKLLSNISKLQVSVAVSAPWEKKRVGTPLRQFLT